jgi:hypothetical protein
MMGMQIFLSSSLLPIASYIPVLAKTGMEIFPLSTEIFTKKVDYKVDSRENIFDEIFLVVDGS